MAKFVLSGRSNCPNYAKAEILADKLQNCLPNFQIRKISIPPEKWKGWVEDVCEGRGWGQQQSPLVWRELVHQGGKALLIGGLKDFLQHCKDYYNVTSDMPSETMTQIAEENLETQKQLIEEEHQRAALVRHVWISSALSSTSQFLVSRLLSADIFPDASAVDVHLLDLDGDEEELRQLKDELEHRALPRLRRVTAHADLERAYQEADLVVLLDEPRGGGARAVSERYRRYGRLIDARARRDARVIVAGESFVNLRCSLLLDAARSLGGRQFVALATQLENEARATVARKLGVRPSDVRDVIVWGNISGSFYVDLQKARVFNYDGAVKGPPSFSLPVQNVLRDRDWIETDLQGLVLGQRAAVVSRTSRAAAMSCSHGVLAVLRAWSGLGAADQVFSLGVRGSGEGFYDLPDDAVLSVPLAFAGGKWTALSDVTVGPDLKERLRLSANEIRQFC